MVTDIARFGQAQAETLAASPAVLAVEAKALEDILRKYKVRCSFGPSGFAISQHKESLKDLVPDCN